MFASTVGCLDMLLGIVTRGEAYQNVVYVQYATAVDIIDLIVENGRGMHRHEMHFVCNAGRGVT